MKNTVLAFLVVFVFLPLGVAEAVIWGAHRHEVDPGLASIDTIPPSAPDMYLDHVARGHGPKKNAIGVPTPTPDDRYGVAWFGILSLRDNHSESENIGLRVELLGGSAVPDSLKIPKVDFRTKAKLTEHFFGVPVIWDDGATDEQEPVSFSVVFFAVDEAGNVSSEGDTLSIVDP